MLRFGLPKVVQRPSKLCFCPLTGCCSSTSLLLYRHGQAIILVTEAGTGDQSLHDPHIIAVGIYETMSQERPSTFFA
jgi:hypothetical protein